MLYINRKTGYRLESDCEVSGGDWEEDKPQPETQPKKTAKKTAKKEDDE